MLHAGLVRLSSLVNDQEKKDLSQVLVTNMNRKYQTCSAYCGSIGRDCLGAWEEVERDFR